jgi:malonyl-CoA/methylmalonyl-CoA synthetase
VRPGDRVAVKAEKSPELLMLYLGVLIVGAVYLPLNTAYTAAEVDFFLSDAEPALLVEDPPALLAAAGPALAEVELRSGADLAAVVYTSGTTGRSKGAMLSHGALEANARALTSAWGFSASDVLLHILPMYHIHGLFIALHPALLSGARILYEPSFSPARAIALMQRASVMMGVPTHYTRLLAEPDFTAAAAAGVRLFVSGSAPLHPKTFEAFAARTGKRVLERYGMSEAGVIASNPLEGERVAGSVGRALEGYEVRVAGGGVGAIEIRGPSLFSGYWGLPEKTREEFTVDGFFITGDVGRLDEEQRLWISDRSKDLIITGGLNVYPREVEIALDALPGVQESAVVGAPHPDFGEAVVAFVVGEGSEAMTLEGLKGTLAGFKRPKRVLFLEELPRNALGKVRKTDLRSQCRSLFV